MKRSLHIQARLHPDAGPKEADAIDIWRAWTDPDGEFKLAPRAVLTDLILHGAGRTPEMYETAAVPGQLAAINARLDQLADINARLTLLTTLVENNLPQLLREIKRTDPAGLRRFAETDADDDGELGIDPEFIRNAKKAARKSFRQTQRERGEQ